MFIAMLNLPTFGDFDLRCVFVASGVWHFASHALPHVRQYFAHWHYGRLPMPSRNHEVRLAPQAAMMMCWLTANAATHSTYTLTVTCTVDTSQEGDERHEHAGCDHRLWHDWYILVPLPLQTLASRYF